MKKIVVVIIFICFSLVQVNAQEIDKKYIKSLTEMFRLTGTEETYEVAIKNMLNYFREEFKDVEPEFIDELEAEFLKTSINDITEMLAPIYFKHLSQSDLDEIIVFYKSPVGQKLANKTPLITGESMAVGQEWGREIGEEIVRRLKEKRNN